ncbi:TetR/AcrR family transcriptional regulator [Streptomyces nigra]|uniref:TetR/AcrR family transcriptional regulator n=1 Tax=Streptomyces nigra TaxID=1827580 RepID=UPI00382466FB
MKKARSAERSDAVRNRARVLKAASDLVAQYGVGELTMERVAVEAAVGKATVFRHFGDRVGLLRALLERSEQRFRDTLSFGPPPVGPGAPALIRLHAFGCAALETATVELELRIAATGKADESFSSDSYTFRRDHLLELLAELMPEVHGEVLTHLMLGYFDPARLHYLHLRRGVSLKTLDTTWHDILGRMVTRSSADALGALPCRS